MPAPRAADGLPKPETVAPAAVTGPEENPPPARAPEPPPDKPKAGPEARRKKTRREAEPDLFASPIASTKGPDKTAGEAVGQGPAEPKGAESPLVAPAQPEGPGTGTNTSHNRPPKPASRLPAEVKPLVSSTEEKPAPARPARPLPPVNPAQLREAVNQILPLLAGQDPGARDCLADNRPIFQSAFAPEAYAKFEQCIRKRDFDSAQEQLKKAVKKHAIM
jgi:hypothetical protein